MKFVIRIIKKAYYRTDKILLLTALTISSLSILLLLGLTDAGFVSSSRTVLVQGIAVAAGAFGAIVLTFFSSETLAKLWRLYVPLVVVLMLATLVIGSGREGSNDQSWIVFAGVSVQPSEFLKLAFILSFSLHLSAVKDEMNTIKNLFFLGLHAAVPIGLILLQSDEGVALIMASIILIMLLVGGLALKWIITMVVASLVIIPSVWFFVLSDFQRDRFMIVFDPSLDPTGQGISYQQVNGLTALGSGQMFGNGIFYDDHVYVPDNYNDFIFTFLGESLGFVGCIFFLMLILILCARIMTLAFKADKQLNKLICVGVTAMIIVQTTVNIGMCLMITPVIGVTLPLLSAGGSSVLSTYLALGLVMCAAVDNNKNMFS